MRSGRCRTRACRGSPQAAAKPARALDDRRPCFQATGKMRRTGAAPVFRPGERTSA
jgi:hypothetical protein